MEVMKPRTYMDINGANLCRVCLSANWTQLNCAETLYSRFISPFKGQHQFRTLNEYSAVLPNAFNKKMW